MSSRNIQYNEQQQQPGASGNAVLKSALLSSYYKMQQYTSSSLIRVQEFDKLLWVLGDEIRQAYQPKASGNTAAKKQGQGQNPTADSDAKRLQAECEQALFLSHELPHNFQPLLYKFFNESLRNFRALTDPAKLYFADFSILEVEEDSRSLREKRARRFHIDVFKRDPLKSTGSKNSSVSGNGALSTGNPMLSPPFLSPSEYLRRCVRCAAIMEDIAAARPGYTFVLAQQRKCSCSGNWGFLPRSAVFS
ncbi:Mediator of RNA polymerase II transcription subunit 16 [Sporothrix epigloea]|uniref:Mediator of RNA polymerase II transcription subunit 16 n=1 Tax=Sporothrix epigloea TaxID=1892477 RepID=A0ABP0E071_9PEZI